MKILGWGFPIIVVTAILVNAFFMLASPRAWFRLPSWIRASGSLTEQKYASGRGGIEVRCVGAVFLGIIGWVLYDSLINR
jgi:hypothetical protein